uniref:Alcohol dehydrogenase n=1 Tax=Acidianus sulfidivorans JP7 TaxID=619593 RepID=A0A2U9IQE6_9CREN
MKAAVFKEIGKPLVIEDVKDPQINQGEILLKVLATGLCHGDLHIIFGDWQTDIDVRTPMILGHEIVGEVMNDGKKVKKGDIVLVYNAFGCNKCKYCKKGYPQYCENVKILGVQENGGFAEYVKVSSEENLVKAHGNPIELAPLADAGLTAYSSVKDIEEGSNVALLGTGAVSMIALQILKSKNVRTTVVGRNYFKLSKMLELGADKAIIVKNSYSDDLSSKIGREKFDYIIDYVGSNDTLKDVLWMLDRMGELRIVGEFGGEFTVPEQLMVLRGLGIRGFLYGTKKDLEELLNIFYEKKIKTLAVPYKLYEINNAINDLLSERIIGRAVIIP